jgi:MFS family permease
VNEKPRGYAVLVVGHIVSTFGTSIYVVVLMLYLAESTGSARTLGLVQFVSYLPAALIGPVAGAAVDAWNRKRVIIWSDVARGAIMAGLAAVGLVTGSLPLWMLVVATGAVSLAGVAFVPAVHAIIPELVAARRLKQANALRSATSQLANVAGSAVGGALFVLLGAPLLILANGVSFLLSGISELAIRPVQSNADRRATDTATTDTATTDTATTDTATTDTATTDSSATAGGRLRSRVSEGIRFLMRRNDVRGIVTVQAMMNLLLPPMVVVLPFVITDVWGLSADYFGYLFAAVLAGGIVGFVLLSGATVRPEVEAAVYRGALPVIAVVTGGLTLITAPAGSQTPLLVPLLFALVFLAGGAVGVVYIIGVTRIQRLVRPGMRGRVFAALEMLTALLVPFAYAASGFLAEALRSRMHLVFAITACCAALLSVYGLIHNGVTAAFTPEALQPERRRS